MTYEDPRDKFKKTLTFTLTEDHITLLRRAYVHWQDAETGAPEIDPKRPYGNSNVPWDVLEVLGLEDQISWDPDQEDMPKDEEERLLNLHRETELALQVILQTSSFEPGEYVRDPLYGGYSTGPWGKA